MTPQEYSDFRHSAVHELMALNERCKEEFRISTWPRWDYDLERNTLIFSEDGVVKVVASIQVIGTTSRSAGTWMWGWANESLPAISTREVARVREFGGTEDIAQLTKSELPDDEHLGWEMTAIAAKLLGAKGAYRCPGDNGFLYLVYSSIGFASGDAHLIECSEHRKGFATYLCEHLLENPGQQWFSNEPDDEQPWPDAWCGSCEALFLQQGEWNDKNQPLREIKMVCHRCYEELRSQGTKS